ncbi:MAG: 16S rRNA (cytosine(1402)-N(4))-methyltransferase RsmH [Chitinophagales bacterium]
MKEENPGINKTKPEIFHVPVLLNEAIEGLNIKNEGVYVDATFGGGGHTKAILEKLSGGFLSGNEGRLFAFDQDEAAEKNIMMNERLIFIRQNFIHIKRMLRVHGITKVDGVLADLGVSSFQVDNAYRGFAHRLEGVLDMRMDEQNEKTAALIVNTYSEALLQKIFSEYGEVRNAKTLAEKITEARKEKSINTIKEFIMVIDGCIRGNRNRYLAQVFQALRMEVNDELNALKDLLRQSMEILNTGGRLVVISYHSLEDRIVKNFIRSGNTDGIEIKDGFGNKEKFFMPVNKKPVEASAMEIKINPRARSAKMRIAERLKVELR